MRIRRVNLAVLVLGFMVSLSCSHDVKKNEVQINDIENESLENTADYASNLLTRLDNPEIYNFFIEFNTLNEGYMDYLQTHFCDSLKNSISKPIVKNGNLVKTVFKETLIDSTFNSIIMELVEKSVDHTKPKDSISMENLLNLAVKFFHVNNINSDGHYIGKVCTGINNIRYTETQRQPLVEAFCFSSISIHLESEPYNLMKEFISSVQRLYALNLGIDDKDKLMRAQGGVYVLMSENEKLQDMLRFEYGRQKSYLPFVLKP